MAESAQNSLQWQLETLLAHAGSETDPQFGSVASVVYPGVAYRAIPRLPSGFEYGRTANPTRSAAEEVLARAERGVRAAAFASGMAALTAVFHLLRVGDHVVASQDVYGGTFRALSDYIAPLGIPVSWVDTTDPAAVAAACGPRTRLVLVETPSNPLLRVTDIRSVAAVTHEHGALLVVDNTFMTFLRQRPLQLGADLVVYSATKFLAGHNDVLAGVVISQDPLLGERIAAIANDLGAVLSPWDAYLLIRGLKTLPVRLERQEDLARRLAHRLYEHPAVRRVYYPEVDLGDPRNGQRHARQASGPGAVLSFELRDPTAARVVLEGVRVVVPAVSCGATESLLCHPYSQTHRDLPEPWRLRLGITPGLLRLSVGLEHWDDLWGDLRQALDAAHSHRGPGMGGNQTA